MKTKSTRKRLLVSSVSMLLVSMLALGTATYAWFTQSPNANASGLTIKATAANGLKILTETHKDRISGAGYSTADYLNHNGNSTTPGTSATPVNINAASFTFTNNSTTLNGPFVTTAGADNNYAANQYAAVTKGSKGYTGSNDVYTEKIFCKLVGVSDSTATTDLNLSNIEISWNNSSANTTEVAALQSSLRMIVTYNDKVVGAYATSAINNEKSLNGEVAAAESDEDKAGDTKGYKNVSSSTVSYSVFPTTSAKIGTVGTTGNDYVQIYMFLDGEDDDCKTSNITLDQLLTGVTVNLSIPTT